QRARGAGVPDPEAGLPPAGGDGGAGQPLAAGGEGECGYGPVLVGEGAGPPAAGRVPEEDLAGRGGGEEVPAGAGEQAAVGGEGEGADRLEGAPAQRDVVAVARRLPHAQLPGPAGGHQRVPRLKEGEARDPLRVPAQGGEVPAGERVPDPHGAVLAPGGQGPAGRAERHAGQRPGVPGEVTLLDGPGRVPEQGQPGGRVEGQCGDVP